MTSFEAFSCALKSFSELVFAVRPKFEAFLMRDGSLFINSLKDSDLLKSDTLIEFWNVMDLMRGPWNELLESSLMSSVISGWLLRK